MDEALANRLVRELTDAIAAAAAGSARVDACHTEAREAGLEIRVALAAEVCCVNAGCPSESPSLSVEPRPIVSPPPGDLTPADRRFLKAIRISSGSPAPGRP